MEYEVLANNLPADPFLRGYLECAEWCGIPDEQREAFNDASWPEWDADSLERAREDCEAFQAEHRELFDSYDVRELAQAGHDFYLTRNRHGAGFWDGDYPADVGRRLTDAAHVYGSTYEEFDAASEQLSTR